MNAKHLLLLPFVLTILFVVLGLESFRENPFHMPFVLGTVITCWWGMRDVLEWAGTMRSGINRKA